jgi:hypothetical protein
MQELSRYPLDDAPATLSALSETVAASTGGTSGALYDILLTATAVALRSGAPLHTCLSSHSSFVYNSRHVAQTS